MNQELENVKEKIRKMLAYTPANGCSEGEAMVAATLVGQLLTTYNLTLAKVILDASECVTLVINTHRKSRHPIDRCVVALADFADTKVWLGTNYARDEKGSWSKTKEYHFFGLETDTQMVKYLYEMIFMAIEQETEAFRQSPLHREKQRQGYHGRKLTINFQKGMADRIYNRLTVMTQERHAQEEANTVTWVDVEGNTKCSDIVLVKQNKVESDFEKLGLSLGRAARGKDSYEHDCRRAGHEAGNRVNLNRPIGNSGGKYLE